jgi:hypothetical protein
MANPDDMVQMVADVENLQVHDGEDKIGFTDENVTLAVQNVIAKIGWGRRFQGKQKKLIVIQTRKGGRHEPGAMRVAKGSPLVRFPPIEDSLWSDGNMLKELCKNAARTVSTFLKHKSKIWGNCPESNDVLMQNSDDYLGGCLGEESEKKISGVRLADQEEEGGEVDGKEEEATSLGAAGNLTGTEDHACQEP